MINSNNPFILEFYGAGYQVQEAGVYRFSDGVYLPHTYTVDKSRYCKLFNDAGLLSKIRDISPLACKVLLNLVLMVERNKDTIEINKGRIMKENSIKSATTFYTVIAELCDAQFIRQVKPKSCEYWINPKYFFNGNRHK